MTWSWPRPRGTRRGGGGPCRRHARRYRGRDSRITYYVRARRRSVSPPCTLFFCFSWCGAGRGLLRVACLLRHLASRGGSWVRGGALRARGPPRGRPTHRWPPPLGCDPRGVPTSHGHSCPAAVQLQCRPAAPCMARSVSEARSRYRFYLHA